MNDLHHDHRRRLTLSLILTMFMSVSSSVFAQGSLVALYTFDGNANDASGNNHHGTIHGATLASDRFGSPNSAFAFDGNDWIEVRHSNRLNFGPTSTFTVNAWVKACTTQDEFAGIVAKGPTNTYIPGYQLVIRNELPEGLISRDNGDFVGVLGTKRILDSSWHMLTLIVSAPNEVVKLYIDGVLSQTSRGSGIDPSVQNFSNLFIGKERNSTRYAKGAIDDVSIFDYALSDATIANAYREGGWPFFAGQGSLSIQTPEGTSYCRTGRLQLIASGSLRYRWTPATGLSNPNIANPIASPTVTTTYTVTGLREDFPCGTTLTAQVTITVGDPAPNLGPDTTICLGSAVAIGGQPTGGSAPFTYRWTPVTGLSDPSAARPIASPSVTTDYIVEITDASGCTGLDTIRVNVVPAGLSASAATIDFGSLAGCSASMDTTVVVVNNGRVPLDLSGVSISGPGYVLIGIAPSTTLAPGDTAVITIRFSPSTSGRSDGRLQIRTAPCDADLVVNLTATSNAFSASLDPSMIDLGSDLGCATTGRDTIVHVANLGTSPLTIVSATVAAPFSVVGPLMPVQVLPGARQAIGLRVAPVNDGAFSATLTVIITDGTCVDTLEVALHYQRLGLILVIAGESEHGSHLPGDTAIRQQVIINRGQTDIGVDSVTVGAPFRVVATLPALPAVLRPGDSIVVTTEYVATDSVDASDLTVFTERPCTYRASLTLRGAGDERAYCRVYIPHLSAASGEILDVPLLLDSSNALAVAGALDFTATIAFDRTLLYPAEGYTVSADDTLRRVVVTGSRIDGSGVLAIIPMTAMLGRVDSTVMWIEAFQWLQPRSSIATTTVDGSFTLARNCPEGGDRNYLSNGLTLLRAVRPNPVTTTALIEFDLVETGPLTLTIVDGTGRLVRTLVNASASAGSFSLPFDLTALAPGHYLLVLETQTLVRSERFKVVR